MGKRIKKGNNNIYKKKIKPNFNKVRPLRTKGKFEMKLRQNNTPQQS